MTPLSRFFETAVMRSFAAKSLATALIVSGAAFSASLGADIARAQDKVVVRVNDKAITESEIRLAEAEIGTDLSSIPEADRRRVLVEYLIENQLLADAAEKSNLASGAAFDERMKYYRRRALRDAYFDKMVRSKVTEADARKLYDRQIGSIKPTEEIRARHILVDKESEARDIIEQLARGADFAKLAKEKSKGPSKIKGGDLGYFSKGQMVKAFEEAAFKLKKGQVSEDPVKTQFGWHVIKVEDRRTRPLPSFESVKDRIMVSLVRRKAAEILGGLRGKAKIEYVDPALKKAAEDAGRGSFSGR